MTLVIGNEPLSMSNKHATKAKLESGLIKLGLDVPAATVEALLVYMALLREWSETYNLIAPKERAVLLERHILDSLSIARFLQPGALLDVGAGAGLPGLPLAIINPQMVVTLIDSAGKKIRFIRHVGRTLHLGNIHPLHQRVESLGLVTPRDHAQNQVFANITSRAFASLQGFAEAVRSCADEDTRLLAMKGKYPRQELEELPGWVNLHSVEQLSVPDLHAQRHLVIMSLSN